MRVRTAAPGPAGHGVVRHADRVAELAGAHGVRRAGARADLTHAQFTDALWGPDVLSAAAAFCRHAADLPRPLVVTLHDVPGADPDPRRDARRTAGYRRVAAAADLVLVSSRHEAAKVRAFGPVPEVIPLPLPAVAAAGPTPAWADRPTLGVLGFVYPGKGHAEAITAAAAQPGRPRVVAAGALSPGHGELWVELSALAAAAGVELLLTGPLDARDLVAAARAVTVPVAPNHMVSASGSLLSWLACGRRPLAAGGAYAGEIGADHPGSVRQYEPDDLGAAVAAALADPADTYAAPPPWPDVGARHCAAYARALGC